MKICKKCSDEFEPTKGLVSYCSLQCRNSRDRSDEVKKKISDSILKLQPFRSMYNGSDKILAKNILLYNENPNHCKICKTKLEYNNRKKKTCSRLCSISASTNRSYRNGSRKTIIYNGVVLESSWELEIAQLLDSKNIKWIRPACIKWISNDGKSRLYYPDFYLTDYDMYLDPKNPHCMEVGKEKMEKVSTCINIIYGDISIIKNYIESVV
jgi:hypothetical protein